jgi:hypothetical protein
MAVSKATTKADIQSTDESPAVADAPAEKTVAFTSPWGSKVTVGEDVAELFKDAGYKPAK